MISLQVMKFNGESSSSSPFSRDNEKGEGEKSVPGML